MKKYPYPVISLSGMARRAVIARCESLDDFRVPRTPNKDEMAAYLRRQEEIDAAIKADPDTNRGGEIETALNVALKQAVARGARGADALAEAAITDPRVLEIINRPGSAAVILRQLIGYALLARDDDDDDDDTILTDSGLLRKIQDADNAAATGPEAPAPSV
jgi:hypothetical protein